MADHLLDFGPEGGDGGGEIVAVGTPEQVAENPASWTGRYLKEVLDRHEERRKGRVAALTAEPAAPKRAKARKSA
ncbi:UvrABC system protein A [compost metagenome]